MNIFNKSNTSPSREPGKDVLVSNSKTPFGLNAALSPSKGNFPFEFMSKCLIT